MTEPARIRRILVALDPSAASQVTLQAAARLASGLAAELRGVFVEDEELLRLARLPIASEVRPGEVAARALSVERLARELATQAAHMERELAGLAARLKFSWSFSVLQAAPGVDLADLGEQVDLVLCAGAAGARFRSRGLGQTARQLAQRGTRPVLLAGRGGLHGPVCAMCAAGHDSARLLAQAQDLQRVLGGPLLVLGPRAGGPTLPAGCLRRRLDASDARTVAAAVRDCGVLVLDGAVATEPWLRELSEGFPGSLLLVRQA